MSIKWFLWTAILLGLSQFQDWGGTFSPPNWVMCAEDVGGFILWFNDSTFKEDGKIFTTACLWEFSNNIEPWIYCAGDAFPMKTHPIGKGRLEMVPEDSSNMFHFDLEKKMLYTDNKRLLYCRSDASTKLENAIWRHNLNPKPWTG
jgi:hypothetical protein